MWWAGLVQAGLGVIQTGIAAAAMKNLPKPQEYEVTEGLKDVESRYRKVADQGASSAERAAFNQMMARQTNSSNRTLQSAGMGGLVGAISGIYNIDAQNRFAASSEAIRRQGLSGLAGVSSQIQGIKNMNTSAFNTELNMKRQALGNAMQAGTQNMVGGITGSMGAKFAKDQNQAYMDAFGPNNQGAQQDPTMYSPPPPPDYYGTQLPPNSSTMFSGPGSISPYYEGTIQPSMMSGGGYGQNMYGFNPYQFNPFKPVN